MRKDNFYMKILIVGVIFIAISSSGCASRKGAGFSEKAKKDGEDTIPKKVRFLSASDLNEETGKVEGYRIEVDDILEISVWQIEELQKEVVVRPDGKISFPLIGDVEAQGKTIDELRSDVVDKIKLYIKVPQVSVNIKEFGGKRAVILGEVNSPGVIRFTSPIRISEAVALAAGFTYDANKGAVYIIRDLDKDEPVVIAADLNKIFFQGKLSENALVKQDDIIYVQTSMLSSLRDFMNNTFGPLVGYVEAYYGFAWRRQLNTAQGRKWRYPQVTTESTKYQYGHTN